jgi:hypothetical protein
MKERLKTLAQQLKDAGIRVIHYPQNKICQEQFLFYFYLIPNCEDYIIFSVTFNGIMDEPEDSIYTVILLCASGNLNNEFLSFGKFFDALTNEHKEIFCFYLDLFNNPNFVN